MNFFSQDITFCMNKCDKTDCNRNQFNIIEPNIPHSFSHFRNTPICPYFKSAKEDELTTDSSQLK